MNLRFLQRVWFWMVVSAGLVATGWFLSAAPVDPGGSYVDGVAAKMGWIAVLAGTPVLMLLCVIAAEDRLERRSERRLG